MEQSKTVGIVTCWAVHKYCRSVLKFYYQNRTPVIPLVAAGSARSRRRMQQQHRMAVVACQPTRAIWSMRAWHLGQGLRCSASSQAQLQQTQMCSLNDRVDGRVRATVMSDLPGSQAPAIDRCKTSCSTVQPTRHARLPHVVPCMRAPSSRPRQHRRHAAGGAAAPAGSSSAARWWAWGITGAWCCS